MITESSFALAGSYAMGQADAFSDIDLILISDRPLPATERGRLATFGREMVDAVGTTPVDVLIYSRETFLRQREDGADLAWWAHRTGVARRTGSWLARNLAIEPAAFAFAGRLSSTRTLAARLSGELDQEASPSLISSGLYAYALCRRAASALSGPRPDSENFSSQRLFEALTARNALRAKDLARFWNDCRRIKAGGSGVIFEKRLLQDLLAELDHQAGVAGGREYCEPNPTEQRRWTFFQRSRALSDHFASLCSGTSPPIASGQDYYKQWIASCGADLGGARGRLLAQYHADLWRLLNGYLDRTEGDWIELLRDCVGIEV